MFDPKVLLDAMVAGAAHRPQDGQPGGAGFGGLSDILGQLAKAAQPAQQQQELPQAGGGQMTGGGLGGIGDILSKPGQGAQQAGGGQPGVDLGEILRKLVPGGGSTTASQANASPGGGSRRSNGPDSRQAQPRRTIDRSTVWHRHWRPWPSARTDPRPSHLGRSRGCGPSRRGDRRQ